jgi:effector-binding domain-containing protein
VTKRRQPLGQSIGGVLFGFEQQVFRNVPPPHELVHHARPDAEVPAGDGSMVTLTLPVDDGREQGGRPMTDMAFREMQPQQTVAVRVTIPMAEVDMAALFGQYLPKVGAWLGGVDARPAGAPFGRYHQWGPETADVEIGIPVAEPPPGAPRLADVEPGEIGTSELPGGLAGVATHVGSYDGLPATYTALHDWIHAQGREEGEAPWEAYVDDPASADPETVRTDVVWLVA